MKEEIFRKCVKSLLENGMHLTNSNIELQSVLVKGGPITKSDAAKYMHKYVSESLREEAWFSPIIKYLLSVGLISLPKKGSTGKYTSELSEIEIVSVIQEFKH